jgi:hypothetical protein
MRSIDFTFTDLAGVGLWGDNMLPEKQTYFNWVPAPKAYRVRIARFTG